MLRDEIVGTWELVSYLAQDDRGGPAIYPLGPDAVGLIMYTPDGYMSAQLMRRGRPDYDLPNTAGATAAQAATAAQGYLAYGGPYEVDESTAIIHHEVVVSLLPNWLNTALLRRSSLNGNRLTLAADTFADGATVRATLVWARASSHATSPATSESSCETNSAATHL
jgi:Lipocalin-like domain